MVNQVNGNLCCETLSNLTKLVGRDDIAILAYSSDDFQFFLLQARSIPVEEEPKLRAVPKDFPFPQPFHIVMQIGIKYCPFCGANLAQLIESNIELFETLASKHRQFLTPSLLFD